MSDELKRSADAIFEGVVNDDSPSPASRRSRPTVTVRSTRARPASGRSDRRAPFTTDTVCAIFSTTKAIAGTVA